MISRVTASTPPQFSTYAVKFQLEYKTRDGTLFGPAIEYSTNAGSDVGFEISRAWVNWQGEAALLVFVYDPDEAAWVLWKRAVVNSYGNYNQPVFDNEDYDGEFEAVQDAYPDTSHIEEGNVVLMSQTNRPWEATFARQFNLPGGERVRGMFPARRQEDDRKSYRFYLASDKSIYVVQPDPADNSAALSTVDDTIGVVKPDPTTDAVHAVVPSAAVIYGTDGRLHILSGRRRQYLLPKEMNFWSQVNDLAYDPIENELAIATDAGIWFYDFERSGLYRQYDITADFIMWDEENEFLVYREDGGTSFHQLDEGGAELVAEVQTQPLANLTDRTQIQRAQIRYEAAGYSPTDYNTWATLKHTLLSTSQSVEVSAPSNRPVYLTQLEGQGHKLRISGFSKLRDIALVLRGEDMQSVE